MLVGIIILGNYGGISPVHFELMKVFSGDLKFENPMFPVRTLGKIDARSLGSEDDLVFMRRSIPLVQSK